MNEHQLQWLTGAADSKESVITCDLPYVPTPVTDLGKRVLVLAPHPDDEVFGLGGTLHLLRKAGAIIRVVVVTGGAGRSAPDLAEATASMRQAESREASLVLGGYELHFEAFTDGLLDARDPRLCTVIDRHIQEFKPDTVLSTGPSEVHPDHRNLGLLCLRLFALQCASESAHALPEKPSLPASEGLRLTWELAFYEIGPWVQPTDLVDVTAVIAVKHQAMLQFKSELVYQDYPRHIRALNQLRSYSLPKTVLAAEAFCRISKLIDLNKVNTLTGTKTPPLSMPESVQRAGSICNMVMSRLAAFRG